MSQNDLIKYKNNFLDQVIVRLDFNQLIPSEYIFKEKIEKTINMFFPNKGKIQILRFNSINFTIDKSKLNLNSADSQIAEGRQCEYFSINTKNKLILSNQYMIFEINEYDSFDELKKSLLTILSAFFEEIETTITRTGIRYINLFNSTKIKVNKNYFSPEINATLSTKPSIADNGMPLVRAISLDEYREGAIFLNFRHGMFNLDYPNPIKEKSFTLDYDCYTEEPIDNIGELISFFEKGHEQIQSLFELSITDQLRKVMENG